jgi:hypothetical protein
VDLPKALLALTETPHAPAMGRLNRAADGVCAEAVSRFLAYAHHGSATSAIASLSTSHELLAALRYRYMLAVSVGRVSSRGKISVKYGERDKMCCSRLNAARVRPRGR